MSLLSWLPVSRRKFNESVHQAEIEHETMLRHIAQTESVHQAEIEHETMLRHIAQDELKLKMETIERLHEEISGLQAQRVSDAHMLADYMAQSTGRASIYGNAFHVEHKPIDPTPRPRRQAAAVLQEIQADEAVACREWIKQAEKELLETQVPVN